MNGLTSAGGSAGGLRVVAEGTIENNITIDLPAPAKIVYACEINADSTNSKRWMVATPQQRVGSVDASFVIQFSSPSQFRLISAMGLTYYYLVLG